MLSWNEPDDRYDTQREDEAEWPGELPDYVEEWNQLWREATMDEKWHRYFTGYGGRYPRLRQMLNLGHIQDDYAEAA